MSRQILRLQKQLFFHGDIRNKEDLTGIRDVDCVIDCSAEPSVLAGYSDESPEYVINTNFFGTINCLEVARKNKADFLFLSTSRVYPTKLINSLKLVEKETRFELAENQPVRGASSKGISEDFPIEGASSFYGATKLASEILINEYIDAYDMRAVIDRCGVIAGPWQMGKVDQGLIVLWAAKHYFKGELNYIGYGGEGKQVRDIIHIQDLYRLLKLQLENIEQFSGKTYNVGGGREFSVSLLELTKLCEKYTGNKIKIGSVKEDRTQDVPIYLTDTTKIKRECGWKPKITIDEIVKDVVEWIRKNEKSLKPILS